MSQDYQCCTGKAKILKKHEVRRIQGHTSPTKLLRKQRDYADKNLNVDADARVTFCAGYKAHLESQERAGGCPEAKMTPQPVTGARGAGCRGDRASGGRPSAPRPGALPEPRRCRRRPGTRMLARRWGGGGSPPCPRRRTATAPLQRAAGRTPAPCAAGGGGRAPHPQRSELRARAPA